MPRLSGTPQWLKTQPVLLGLVVLVFSFFTFFWNYTNPPYLYWDENYHIASAQKYLNGVYFMEPHPPLGKMLIAAGEKLFNVNPEDDQFIGTDYAKELPVGFSFLGYRFFPVLFGWLIAPLLYMIFFRITRKPVWAFLLSFLYIFDNALITHSRAAMLDSTMLFFCIATIACYFQILNYRASRNGLPLWSLLMGIAFACAMATKALALILVLLWLAVILQLRNSNKRSNELTLLRYFVTSMDFSRIGQFVTLSIAGFLIAYVGIWQAHFMIGKTIIPTLPDGGYYQASQQYKDLLQARQVNIPLMLKENLDFLSHYSAGVPQLNLCKADENGSPFFLWPFGARSINYRWETPNSSYYQYITLQVNPVVWGVALLGLLMAFAMLVGSWIIPRADSEKQPRLRYGNELMLWCGMWLAFMLAVSRIGRVMYLYHYFIPLIFSFIVCGYVVMELKQLGALRLNESRKNWMLLFCATLIFAGFQFYRPLTYYEPINDTAFKQRMIFPLWDLKCVNCPKESLMAVPLVDSE